MMTLEQEVREALESHIGSQQIDAYYPKLARDLAERIERVYTAGFQDGGRYSPHRLVANRNRAAAVFMDDKE